MMRMCACAARVHVHCGTRANTYVTRCIYRSRIDTRTRARRDIDIYCSMRPRGINTAELKRWRAGAARAHARAHASACHGGACQCIHDRARGPCARARTHAARARALASAVNGMRMQYNQARRVHKACHKLTRTCSRSVTSGCAPAVAHTPLQLALAADAAAALRVVDQVAFFLLLHRRDPLHEVFVAHDGRLAAQREHACTSRRRAAVRIQGAAREGASSAHAAA